jgi:glycosyltransferase involved in cell wall biosynthesis
MTGREDRFVPHLVGKGSAKGNLRKELGILSTARVFGRHGGADTFDIPFVQKLVGRHAKAHPSDHFIFLNTREFLPPADRPANIHFLAGTADPDRKAAFLESCDAMLHARSNGETFGLAVGEFAVRGKPVITYGKSRERAHLEMLGREALVYQNEQDLRAILGGFVPRAILELVAFDGDKSG